MTIEAETRNLPPYISYSTLVTLLDWLREMKVVPHQFDRSVWKDKFAGSTGAQVASALRFFGLLDGDRTTSRLDELAAADNAERKRLLRELFRETYGAEFVDQLARATPRMVDEHFTRLGASDATHRKAVAFFVNAAKAVEFPLPPQIAKRARNRPSGVGRRSPNGKAHRGAEGKGTPDPKPADAPKPPKDGATLTLHPLLLALLNDLERVGPGWSKAERDRWVAIFEGNLDYAYPAEESGS